MKILFVASGNRCEITPVVRNQGNALVSDGMEVDYYQIRGKGFKGYLKNVRPLRKYLREHKYDAIHAHYSLSAFVASLAGAKPLVVSLMGCDVNAAKWFKFIIRLFAMCFRWKAIIVKSNGMYRALGMKNAVVIPNGVDLVRFSPKSRPESREHLGWDSKKVHVLFPANADRPEKDYALAKEAVGLLQSDLRFKILDFRYEGVELHSFENIPNEETPYWYNAADVVLLTSKREGSPNAIKEAMACNRPIVATKVGDIAERLHNLDGCFVVPIDDRLKMIEELARAIEKALTFDSTKGREKIIADGLEAHEINRRLISIYGKK